MTFTRRQLFTGTKSRPLHPAHADARPWQAHIGAACLARQGVECRICGETCTAGAIHFTLQLGGPARPRVDPAQCDGCGQCLPGCPAAAIQEAA